MPAKSQQQQKFMGMVHALNKGDIEPSSVSKSVRDVAKNIKKSDAEDFASTKHSGLPKRVKKEILDALKEYANKMSGNKLGGSGSYGYAPQKGLRDDDGYTNEAKRSVVYKAAKKGSFPVTLVVVKNGKVIDQDSVKTPEAVPAAFNVIQSKHKGATIHIEDKTGKRLFSESVKESKLKGQLAGDSVQDIIKSIGSRFVSGEIKNTKRDGKTYLKLTDEKFGSGVVKILKSRFGIDAKVDYYGGKGKVASSPSVSFFSDTIIDESKGVPQNYMQGRTSDYHTALRGKNRDYSGGTNFKKTNHGQPDLENDDEDQETNQLSVQQTPLKETIFSKDVDDAMKEFGIKKIPIDSVGTRILNGLKKEKFIDKIDNKTKLLYFYGTIPKGKKYSYASEKKPLSPLVNRFSSDLFSDEIYFTSKVAAYQVAMNIVDMYNNNEEIDSPYYLLKNYFNSFGMDTNRSKTFNSADYQLDQWLKRNKKYEKAMIKEAKLDHHRISGNSIELLVRHNREKFAIRFKDKRILDKMGFDWSKPKNIEKLLSLKKFPKGMSISKSFHEYGQRLDLSYLEDEEARLDGTPKPKDAIDRDIDENVKQMTSQILRMKKGEMKPYELPSKTQKFYYKNKKKFDSLKEYSAGSYEYTKGDQYGQNSIDETMIRRAVDLAQELLPKDIWSRYANDGNKNKEFVKSIVRDLAQLLNKFYKSHDVSVRIKEEVLNEIGMWRIDHYTGSKPGTIVPSRFSTIKNDKDKEKKRAVEKDLAGTLNSFWKRWSIPFRIDLSKTQR